MLAPTIEGAEIRTRTLAQHVDNLLTTGCESAHRTAECLAQGAGEDIDTTIYVEQLSHTMAGSAYHSG